MLPHMINTQHRWPLPVILGSVVLLLAGTGLFLTARHDVRATTPAPSPSGNLTTDSFDDAAGERPAMERLG